MNSGETLKEVCYVLKSTRFHLLLFEVSFRCRSCNGQPTTSKNTDHAELMRYWMGQIGSEKSLTKAHSKEPYNGNNNTITDQPTLEVM